MLLGLAKDRFDLTFKILFIPITRRGLCMCFGVTLMMKCVQEVLLLAHICVGLLLARPCHASFFHEPRHFGLSNPWDYYWRLDSELSLEISQNQP